MSEQPSTSADAGGAAAAALKTLEEQLMESLWKTHTLQKSVENFSESSGAILNSRVNGLVAGMGEMSALGEPLRDVKVPVDLLRYIDEGGSPDEFTAEMLKRCLTENQMSKGKANAFKELERALLAKIQEEFPEDATTYLGAVDQAKPAKGNASK
uniref:Mediator of RNA polymerase II transcription subunit 10 n=1 Tax=Tetraselmis chuii TaxID=63592 RepID=A0A7S1SYW4_9CHLO|mmetsp:Transcript_36681/g.65668  ORF Transcript_36681/g.65668 Transcript_36681/m.65668 type:complete len:155 (+) Transcript_36681:289-753(+)|eukprot:CAMPEP_0177763642 /NCGR_PEP_ID=MMETSP0491_2-20121128/6977_1 /TAXON_ID=63592 /ORGANISM="Tetraselmis chuii, Strain PLY429" /LENGTH=154 /DNA_ID=CAMNT_0019279757 /DNA_START=284 /DNA_END=748 /DNA_ORIENTATION=+